MGIFRLCHYLTCTFFNLYSVMQHTNCKIFSYSHIMYIKLPAAREQSISITYILRRHLFIQNDSYNNILTFGPLIQNLLYDTSTMTSSSLPPNRNAGNKNNGYHLVTYQDMLPFYAIFSPHITRQAVIFCSFPFFSLQQ